MPGVHNGFNPGCNSATLHCQPVTRGAGQLMCRMNNQRRTITPRVIVQYSFLVVVIPFLPLLISRCWDWWEAWVFAVICILGFAISRALVLTLLSARRHVPVGALCRSSAPARPLRGVGGLPGNAAQRQPFGVERSERNHESRYRAH